MPQCFGVYRTDDHVSTAQRVSGYLDCLFGLVLRTQPERVARESRQSHEIPKGVDSHPGEANCWIRRAPCLEMDTQRFAFIRAIRRQQVFLLNVKESCPVERSV